MTEEEIRKYKTIEREVFEKYDSLSGNGLNSKNNKQFDVMTSIMINCRGGENITIKINKITEFRRKIRVYRV